MHSDFKQMIELNEGRIRYIASRYSHEGEFEDMYQEILLQLWRSFESFKGNANRSTWVYKVALNTACTFVKQAVKHKEIKSLVAHKTLNAAEPEQHNSQVEILNRFMNALNDTDASILMMYLDGFTSDESAEVIGISPNAVRSRIKRIKNEFENRYLG
ncbi:MAG: sigma-70 family RNA polymerase sigma factor [Gammaproteobacteria bacterium]|nr:sigma-70 family RNA polymerase sigma factor [Gammaproteobacteria bacterium]NNJ72816.1 sigma-70 family RNA polymerase sigma factor [Enterobacterales bacterium]